MSSNIKRFLKAAGYVPGTPVPSTSSGKASNPKRFLKAAGYVAPRQNPQVASPMDLPHGQPKSSRKKSTVAPQKGIKIEEPSALPREKETSAGRPKKKGRINEASPVTIDKFLKDLEAEFNDIMNRVGDDNDDNDSLFLPSLDSYWKMLPPEQQAFLLDLEPGHWFKEVTRILLIISQYMFSALYQLEREHKKVKKLKAEAKEASKLIDTHKKETVEACADRDQAIGQLKLKDAESIMKEAKLKKLELDLAAAKVDAQRNYERGRAVGEASLKPLKKKQRLEVVQDFIKSPVFERLCDRRVGTEVIDAFFKSVKQCQKLKDLPTDFDFMKLNIALNENLEPYPDEDGDECEVDLSSHEFGRLLDTSDPKRSCEELEMDEDA